MMRRDVVRRGSRRRLVVRAAASFCPATVELLLSGLFPFPLGREIECRLCGGSRRSRSCNCVRRISARSRTEDSDLNVAKSSQCEYDLARCIIHCYTSDLVKASSASL
jgi:hypothetical protein